VQGLPEFPSTSSADARPMSFRRVLLNTCQEEFEGAKELRAVRAWGARRSDVPAPTAPQPPAPLRAPAPAASLAPAPRARVAARARRLHAAQALPGGAALPGARAAQAPRLGPAGLARAARTAAPGGPRPPCAARRGRLAADARMRGAPAQALKDSPEEEREALARAAKMRTMGNIRLIAELFKQDVVNEKILAVCIQEMLGDGKGEPHEDDVEVPSPCPPPHPPPPPPPSPPRLPDWHGVRGGGRAASLRAGVGAGWSTAGASEAGLRQPLPNPVPCRQATRAAGVGCSNWDLARQRRACRVAVAQAHRKKQC